MKHLRSPDVATEGVQPGGRASYFSRSELVELLKAHTSDAGLAENLAALTDDTTD